MQMMVLTRAEGRSSFYKTDIMSGRDRSTHLKYVFIENEETVSL